MRVILANPNKQNEIGRAGENDATKMLFDLTELIQLYGEGTAKLIVERPGDKATYEATITREDNSIVWMVDNVDTSYEGHGRAQLVWLVNDVVAKTIIYLTVVYASIKEVTPKPPPPQKRAIIDDTQTSPDFTWSSQKITNYIDDELSGISELVGGGFDG